MKEHRNGIAAAALVAVAAFSILFARAFYLQAVKGDEFERFARQNRLRLEKKPAPRGNIYDRNGEKLAVSRPSFNLKIFPAEMKDSPAALAGKLSTILKLPNEILTKRVLRAAAKKTLSGSVIAADIDRDTLARFEANKNRLPGLDIETGYLRRYPAGKTAAHILGYTSKASARDLKYFGRTGPQGIVGKSGIERKYERTFRGKSGAEQTVRDALGRKVDSARLLGGEMKSRPEIAGNSVYLTIDLEIQKTAEKLLSGKNGAAVVMDVNSGEILALASAPAFNPSKLTGRVDPAYWKTLVENKNSPMLNRALQGRYPPGSVFKPVTAAVLLEEKIVAPEVEVHCPGKFKIGRKTFKCWKATGHGGVGLLKAIAESCDVYFYSVSQIAGVKLINRYADMFGFGRKTGIGLGEKSGINPSKSWKRAKYGTSWHKGETAILSIGQSYLSATPVQVALMTALIANGGKAVKPLLVKKTVSHDGKVLPSENRNETENLKISPETLRFIRRSMTEAVLNGTARNAKLSGVSIAGKTGTAQTVSTAVGKRTGIKPHSWFTAFLPVESPEISVTVLVENAGDGSAVAAPIAREIARSYLKRARKNSAKGDI